MSLNRGGDGLSARRMEWMRPVALLLTAIFIVMALAVRGPVIAHASTKKVTPQYNGKAQKPKATVKISSKKMTDVHLYDFRYANLCTSIYIHRTITPPRREITL